MADGLRALVAQRMYRAGIAANDVALLRAVGGPELHARATSEPDGSRRRRCGVAWRTEVSRKHRD